jgi:phage gp16-like protein
MTTNTDRMRKANERRKSELAKIHIAKQQLRLDDDTYRDILWTLGRVRSARDLDAEGRKAVLEHFRARGFTGRRRRDPGQPAAPRADLVSKVEAQLADLGLEWGYADGIVRQMFGLSSVRFANPAQLQAVIAALDKEQKKLAALEGVDTYLRALGLDRSYVDGLVSKTGWTRHLPTLHLVQSHLMDRAIREGLAEPMTGQLTGEPDHA